MMVRLFSAVAVAAACFVCSAAGLSASDIPADTPVSALLSSAQSHLSRGETSSALVYYDAAVARAPDDYLTLFKRATTYLSLGRASQAAGDFARVLELRPGFEGAHVQLGRIRQRSADWDSAREHYIQAGRTAESSELAELAEAEGAARLAEAAERAGRWEECVNQAGVAIVVASRSPALRETRAHCRFARGEVEEGMGDLFHVLSMKPGDTRPHLVISAVSFFALGDLAKGMAQLRKCLHSDPDSKVCKKLLKQEKAIEKTLAKVSKAFSKDQPSTGTRYLIPSADGDGLVKEVKDLVKALRDDGTIPAAAPDLLVASLVGLACQGYYEMDNKKAGTWCEEALQLDATSLYGLLHKHKGLVAAESFEAAIDLLEKAAEAHPDKRNIISPLLNDVQVRLRRSKTKDYYKVLGIAHDADARQVKSAYRKLSKLHHPDKAAKQGLSKEAAEKKMATINEAYEVLSDPELRARFDRGDDPNSTEQQNPFQGSPFGFGGQPVMFQQAGGQQQFKYQFSGGFPGGFPFGG